MGPRVGQIPLLRLLRARDHLPHIQAVMNPLPQAQMHQEVPQTLIAPLMNVAKGPHPVIMS